MTHAAASRRTASCRRSACMLAFGCGIRPVSQKTYHIFRFGNPYTTFICDVARSLAKIGFSSWHRGICCRPVLTCGKQSAITLRKYLISDKGTMRDLKHPLTIPGAPLGPPLCLKCEHSEKNAFSQERVLPLCQFTYRLTGWSCIAVILFWIMWICFCTQEYTQCMRLKTSYDFRYTVGCAYATTCKWIEFCIGEDWNCGPLLYSTVSNIFHHYFHLPFCGMYMLVDMLQCSGRAALRVKAEKCDCYWVVGRSKVSYEIIATWLPFLYHK